MRLALLLWVVSLAFGQVATDTQFASTPTNAWLLVSMNLANGTDDFSFLNTALSADGIRSAAPNYWLNPLPAVCDSGCVRDPDVGKFSTKWLIPYTCAYMAAPNDVARWCMTTTTDLSTFTAINFVDTSSLSAVLRDWAPNWVKNPDGTVYLDGSSCPHIVFTGTNGTTTFTNYEMHPTNNCSDPSQGGTTWSTPVHLVISGNATGLELDGFIVCDNGSGANCTGAGDNFTCWYINLTLSTSQYIQYATSSTLTGTYTQQSSGGDWMGLGGVNQEGPRMLKLSDRCRLLYDNVPGIPGELNLGQINYSDSFDAGNQCRGGTWTKPSPLQTTTQAKHGMVIPYP